MTYSAYQCERSLYSVDKYGLSERIGIRNRLWTITYTESFLAYARYSLPIQTWIAYYDEILFESTAAMTVDDKMGIISGYLWHLFDAFDRKWHKICWLACFGIIMKLSFASSSSILTKYISFQFKIIPKWPNP